MRLQLRDSWRSCPRDGKRMVIDPLDEEGQRIVTHECLSCGFRERNLAERPQRTDSSFLRGLRERLWTEVAP